MTTPELAKDTFVTMDPLQAAREALTAFAAAGKTMSYRDLAQMLGLRPPRQIQKVATLLEAIQSEDAVARRPQLAAIVIQRGPEPIPRRGFFDRLLELKLYDGDVEGAQAVEWHQAELSRVFRQAQSSAVDPLAFRR